LSNSSVTIAWLGANDADTEGTWQWQTGVLSGTTIATTYWASGEPNQQGGNEDCLSLIRMAGTSATASWNDKECSDTAAYIVEYIDTQGTLHPTLTPTHTLTPSATLTPPPTLALWNQMGQGKNGDDLCYWREAGTNIRHRYHVVRKPATWADAKADAESRYYAGIRGHLVTLSSTLEARCIGIQVAFDERYYSWTNQFAIPRESREYWTAGRSVGTNNAYVWDAGNEAGSAVPAQFLQTVGIQPDFSSGGGRLCLSGNMEGLHGNPISFADYNTVAFFVSRSCDIKLPYVIEFTAVDAGLDYSPTPIASRSPIRTITPINRGCDYTNTGGGMFPPVCPTQTRTRHVPDIYPKTHTFTPTITSTPTATFTPSMTRTHSPTPCVRQDYLLGTIPCVPWDWEIAGTPTPGWWDPPPPWLPVFP